jgi:hypothetical protein
MEIQSPSSERTLGTIEQHWSPAEIAKLLHVDVETVRRLFKDEPGIVVLQKPARKGKRPYRTMRIPQTVVNRVVRRFQTT